MGVLDDRMNLRFPEARAREPAIDAWLDARPPVLAAIARMWFARMRAAGDDVTECLHDGHPTACVGDAPWAYVNAFRAHVNVGFFHGATLADPRGLLEGDGKYMRHVKVSAVRAPDVTALVGAAYRDIKAKLAA